MTKQQATIIVVRDCQNPFCRKKFAQTLAKHAAFESGRYFCTNHCAAAHFRRIHPPESYAPLPPVDTGVAVLKEALRKHGAAQCWQSHSTLERIVKAAVVTGCIAGLADRLMAKLGDTSKAIYWEDGQCIHGDPKFVDNAYAVVKEYDKEQDLRSS